MLIEKEHGRLKWRRTGGLAPPSATVYNTSFINTTKGLQPLLLPSGRVNTQTNPIQFGLSVQALLTGRRAEPLKPDNPNRLTYGM